MNALPGPVRRAAAVGLAFGLVLGIVYAFGGFVIDLMGPGLNGGTALAFLALVGMPALFGTAGLVIGCAAFRLRRR